MGQGQSLVMDWIIRGRDLTVRGKYFSRCTLSVVPASHRKQTELQSNRPFAYNVISSARMPTVAKYVYAQEEAINTCNRSYLLNCPRSYLQSCHLELICHSFLNASRSAYDGLQRRCWMVKQKHRFTPNASTNAFTNALVWCNRYQVYFRWMLLDGSGSAVQSSDSCKLQLTPWAIVCGKKHLYPVDYVD